MADLADAMRASVSEVVRSAQRDDFFKQTLVSDAHTLVVRLLGQRFALRHQPEITAAVHMIYYLTTTARGLQTLGEEYCDIDLLSSHTQLYPTILHRAFLCFLNSATPLLQGRIIPSIHGSVLSFTHKILVSTNKNTLKNLLARLFEIISTSPFCIGDAVSWFSKLHITLFFFTGAYYHFLKRVLRVRYIAKTPTSIPLTPFYRIVGILCAAPLVVSLAVLLRRLATSPVKNEHTLMQQNTVTTVQGNLSTSAVSEEGDWVSRICKEGAVPSCTLCLSARTHPTVTECGHVFCWECIFDACRAKSECPLCRTAIDVRKLIKCHQY